MRLCISLFALALLACGGASLPPSDTPDAQDDGGTALEADAGAVVDAADAGPRPMPPQPPESMWYAIEIARLCGQNDPDGGCMGTCVNDWTQAFYARSTSNVLVSPRPCDADAAKRCYATLTRTCAVDLARVESSPDCAVCNAFTP